MFYFKNRHNFCIWSDKQWEDSHYACKGNFLYIILVYCCFDIESYHSGDSYDILYVARTLCFGF